MPWHQNDKFGNQKKMSNPFLTGNELNVKPARMTKNVIIFNKVISIFNENKNGHVMQISGWKNGIL